MDRRALIGLALVAASAGSAAAAAPASDGGVPANSYINLNSINGSVTRANGRLGVLAVEAGIDVPDAALRATAAASGPRLRSEMAQVVQRAAAGLRPGAPPDVHQLSRDLQFAVNQVLGRRGARVLLGTVMVV
ncbi:MAG: Tat pathway signal protein [Brevundimonas sp.]